MFNIFLLGGGLIGVKGKRPKFFFAKIALGSIKTQQKNIFGC